MLNRTDYLLKGKTEALKAINVHNNYIHTQVIEGKNTTFIVEKPPIAIVKDSLREYGMTYKGALQAAKYKLDKKVHLLFVFGGSGYVLVLFFISIRY